MKSHDKRERSGSIVASLLRILKPTNKILGSIFFLFLVFNTLVAAGGGVLLRGTPPVSNGTTCHLGINLAKKRQAEFVEFLFAADQKTAKQNAAMIMVPVKDIDIASAKCESAGAFPSVKLRGDHLALRVPVSRNAHLPFTSLPVDLSFNAPRQFREERSRLVLPDGNQWGLDRYRDNPRPNDQLWSPLVLVGTIASGDILVLCQDRAVQYAVSCLLQVQVASGLVASVPIPGQDARNWKAYANAAANYVGQVIQPSL